MKKPTTLTVLALIFGILGALFALIGSLFLYMSPQYVLDVQLGLSDGNPEALLACGIVFTAIGAASLIAAAVLLILYRRRKQYREELLLWGTRVTGTVRDIPVDTTVQVNGRCPLRILADVKHPITGQQVTLRSRQVWETSLSNGDPVDVLFDPLDEKKYIVDVK